MSKEEPDGLDRLSEAMAAFAQHRGGPSSRTDEEFLAEHPDLADLLTPLLASQPAARARVAIGERIGDFQLRAPIGRGGMGEVWEAEQISLRRRVALKLLSGHAFSSPQAVQRFQREAEAGARLKHPNIVAVHSIGEQDGIHFIAQELVETRTTLSDLQNTTRQMPQLPRDYYQDVARRFQRIAEALSCAHANGVVHRDIKPSNILIDAAGEPKVADFGMARVEGALELSRTGDFGGSPFYMSPEQAAARRMGLDHRTDVFSLGATMYESLTLARAFDGDTVTQVLKKILIEDPVAPAELRSRCPRDLSVICMKMMEKDPERRYASMAEVAAELGRFLEHRPIVAKPPGAWSRAAKWARRHPVTSAAGSVGLVALVAVSALLWDASRARARADAASREATASAAMARAGEAAAKREAEVAEGVVEFLVGIFQVSLPEKARGREVTAGEILENARTRIETDLDSAVEQPVRARMLVALAKVYFMLESPAEAKPLLEAARPLVASVYPAEHPVALEVLDLQRMRALTENDFVAAERFARELYAGHVAATGANGPDALTAHGRVAMAIERQGRFEEAEAILRQTIDGLRERVGEYDSRRLHAQYYLGQMLQRIRRLEEARAVLESAYEGYSKRFGPDHPEALSLLSTLAQTAQDMGRASDAERLSREAVAITTCVFGSTHRQTLDIRRNLAILLATQSRFKESRDECLGILALARDADGTLRRTGVLALGTLAPVQRELGELDLAAQTYIDAIVGYTQHYGATSPLTLRLLIGLGQTRAMQGDANSCDWLMSEALGGFEGEYPPTHPDRLNVLHNYTAFLLREKRFEDAQARATELLSFTPPTSSTRAAREKLLERANAGLVDGKPVEASAPIVK